VPPLEL